MVRELVKNPRLTEALAVRISARRPCRPETLSAVASHTRWRRAPAVLRTIAQNPWAEPALVVKLLPQLGGNELDAIARDRALHPLVRATAERLAAEKKRRGREMRRGEGEKRTEGG